MHKSMQTWPRGAAVFRPNVRMGTKSDQSEFDRGVIVGARQGGLGIWGFLHTTVSRVCREWCKNQKTSS